MTESTIRGAEFNPTSQTITPFSISVEGREGVGKTHFGLMTAPTPICHVNFGDRAADIFLYDMTSERRESTTLHSFHASSMSGWTREEGMGSLSKLKEICEDEIKGGKLAGGTFILDSGSSWWQVIQECYVAPEEEKRLAAGLKSMGGLIYGPGNLVVRGALNWIKNQGCFTIITHTKRQRWDERGPVVGQYDPQINSQVPGIVEVRLDLRTECPKCGSQDCQAQGHQGRKHIGRIIKFGRNTAYVGMELPDPTFKLIYALYTGRELEVLT